jgi:SAM-dependent methyltransferase
MDRERLAATYARGVGLEIGAFFTPWPVPAGSTVRFADSRTKAELERWAEIDSNVGAHNKVNIPETDYICKAEWLLTVPHNTFDFVLSSHVLEHCFDPILALSSWLMVLKTGGHIIMAVPNKDHTFDKQRPLSDIAELVDQFLRADTERDLARRRRLVREDRSLGHGAKEPELSKEVEEIVASLSDVHFSVWDFRTFRDLLDAALPHMPRAEIVHLAEAGSEIMCVLRKSA